MKGHGRYYLSKRQDFFQNTNSYVLYMWHIIAKHDLIGTSMSMLSDAVGSHDGARGIPSAIQTSNNNDDNNEDNEDKNFPFRPHKNFDCPHSAFLIQINMPSIAPAQMSKPAELTCLNYCAILFCSSADSGYSMSISCKLFTAWTTYHTLSNTTV